MDDVLSLLGVGGDLMTQGTREEAIRLVREQEDRNKIARERKMKQE
jgi:hypothetical protein